MFWWRCYSHILAGVVSSTDTVSVTFKNDSIRKINFMLSQDKLQPPVLFDNKHNNFNIYQNGFLLSNDLMSSHNRINYVFVYMGTLKISQLHQ